MATTDGVTVLNEILDLICARLPQLPQSDPAYAHLACLAPALAQLLHRPAVSLVEGGE